MVATTYPKTSYPTNLKKITVNAIDPPDADKFFNNYFDIPIQVSSNIDSAVIAHFENITENKEAARALASAVIYTAMKQGINPMVVLDEFRKVPPGELNSYTALFLNLERKGSSFLGVRTQPVQNKYVARAILP